MKRLFNEKIKISRLNHAIGYDFDKYIIQRWGFHYSETDSDLMIDALDYGTSTLTWEDFVWMMDEHKKNFGETGKFGIALLENKPT